jgi:pyruvate, orthophosphate dikinase
MVLTAVSTQYVYDFEEEAVGGRSALRGKGVGLSEMTRLGLPVPSGVTVTTDACRAHMESGGFPDGLGDELDTAVHRLEAKTGKTFGSPDDPLLVSVRSGAAISMPGMMEASSTSVCRIRPRRASRARPATRISPTTRTAA